MFETMTSFLEFFIPTVVLIGLGIIFEDKLIAFERRIRKRIREALHESF